MMNLTFDSYWKKMQEYGMEHFDNERLAKECYLHGASSMLGLLISAGMPSPMLDDVEEAIREGKKTMHGKEK